jgi:uncharacterized protein
MLGMAHPHCTGMANAISDTFPIGGRLFRPLYTACVLAEIEAHTKTRIADHFDLIAGTSVGGIIALGLAARKPAAEIRDAFINEGPHIFRTRSPPQTWLGQRLHLRENAFRSKYSSVGLRKVVSAVIDAGTRIGDLPRAFLAPTVNLTKGQPQVFKTDHHPTFMRDWKLRAVDVALATSAAPTFFPVHRIGGELFADGGLYANSPDQLALHEATHFFEKDRAMSQSKFEAIGPGRERNGCVGRVRGRGDLERTVALWSLREPSPSARLQPELGDARQNFLLF